MAENCERKAQQNTRDYTNLWLVQSDTSCLDELSRVILLTFVHNLPTCWLGGHRSTAALIRLIWAAANCFLSLKSPHPSFPAALNHFDFKTRSEDCRKIDWLFCFKYRRWRETAQSFMDVGVHHADKTNWYILERKAFIVMSGSWSTNTSASSLEQNRNIVIKTLLKWIELAFSLHDETNMTVWVRQLMHCVDY